MQNVNLFEIATAAFDKLEEIHSALMQHVSNLGDKELAGCSIAVENNELVATCFGCRLIATHRPVILNEKFSMIEYPFSISETDKLDRLICTLYVHPNGGIYSDTTTANQIAGTGDSFLTQKILPAIGLALIRSNYFSPRN